MLIAKTFTHYYLLLFTLMSLLSCSGQRPTNIGITDSKLSACPASPNCVSSDASDETHNIPPFQLVEVTTDTWQVIRQAVLELPRTEIITETTNYIHAECSSAVFGFVDDLELHLRVSDNSIAIRSASRLGHSDFGVNRKRIETLRNSLMKQGILK